MQRCVWGSGKGGMFRHVGYNLSLYQGSHDLHAPREQPCFLQGILGIFLLIKRSVSLNCKSRSEVGFSTRAFVQDD